jgi:hypothetical protein
MAGVPESSATARILQRALAGLVVLGASLMPQPLPIADGPLDLTIRGEDATRRIRA